MDAFAYLSVLLSIILGLGIAHILTALGRIIRARDAVSLYWPPLLWAGVLLVIYVQSWWSMFGLRGRTDWTFVQFFVVLLQTVTLYMAAALVLPESVAEKPSDRDRAGQARERTDLGAEYYRQVPWFFGFLGATVVVSILKSLVLDGRLPMPADMSFHVFLLVTSVSAIAIRRRWYHEVLAVVGALTFVAYIAALFSRLR